MNGYDQTIPDLIRTTIHDAQDLVRGEIALAKAELRQEVRLQRMVGRNQGSRHGAQEHQDNNHRASSAKGPLTGKAQHAPEPARQVLRLRRPDHRF